MKKIITIIVVLTLGISGYFYFSENNNSTIKNFNFTEVKRGDIKTIITSSGTLEAVSTVEIGTQVSGRIDKIYADFNDKVKRGQLLALLDTTFLAAAVKESKAGLTKVEAQYVESKSKYDRAKKLYDKNFISELEYITARTGLSTAKASLQSAKSNLERTITNQKYAIIRSPINGTIIHRNIERGQTVAASLQAPQLFIIAEDLSKMQILALVDESDIGQIQTGQKVEFNVQTYSDKTFCGSVEQIRLQPKTISNVVNYTVVISADNSDGLLLPGMTATVDFFVEQKIDVLMISNSALRIKPTDEMMSEFREKKMEERENRPDSVKLKFSKRGRGFGESGGFNRDKMKQLWFLDENGCIEMTMIMAGSTDGKNTEILRGKNVSEGLSVINGINQTSNKKFNKDTPPMKRGFGRL